MRFNKSSLYILGLVLNVVISGAPAVAGIEEAFGNYCKAFGVEVPSPQTLIFPTAETVFERANAEFTANPDGTDVLHLAVRAAIRELANRTDWNQTQKVRFWYEIKDLLSVRAHRTLISDEFAGRDGSVVLQGGHEGLALIIKMNGDVYKGAFDPPLELHAKAVWEPDYTDFVLLKPAFDKTQ